MGVHSRAVAAKFILQWYSFHLCLAISLAWHASILQISFLLLTRTQTIKLGISTRSSPSSCQDSIWWVGFFLGSHYKCHWRCSWHFWEMHVIWCSPASLSIRSLDIQSCHWYLRIWKSDIMMEFRLCLAKWVKVLVSLMKQKLVSSTYTMLHIGPF